MQPASPNSPISHPTPCPVISGRRLLVVLIKFGLVVLLATWVLNQIQIKDVLAFERTGTPQTVEGRLQGDFTTANWQFFTRDPRLDVTVLRPRSAFPDKVEFRPGFITLLREMDLLWFFAGFGLWGILLVFAAYRWKLLLRAAQIKTSFLNALRLCFVGYFFNNVMPGVTGGDLVRGALVTRGLEKNRWRAALSVLVDRIIGLFALLSLAAIVLASTLLWGPEQVNSHLVAIGKGVFLLLGSGALLGALYLSRRFRALLGLKRWLSIPGTSFLGKIDSALTVYRQRPSDVIWAFLLSLPLQFCGILSFWCLAQSLEANLDPLNTFVIFPVVQTLSAVPLAPAGWGVGETLYGTFFRWFGSSFTMGVAVSVLFRITTQIGFGLIGGVVWLLSDQFKKHVHLINDPS